MKKKTIIIDDDQAVRFILRNALEKEGWLVDEANDGLAAERLFESNSYDLMVTDIIMPDKEGLETIMQIKNSRPDVKVIAISGGGSVIGAAGCLNLARKLGADRTLMKPIDVQDFLDAVSQLCAG